MYVLNDFSYDGRADAGNGQLAKGWIDVAFKRLYRFGMMTCTPFFIFHGKPFTGDNFKGIVAGHAAFRTVYAALGDRILAFTEKCFDLD